jgi:biopolymer transport protein ExbD
MAKRRTEKTKASSTRPAGHYTAPLGLLGELKTPALRLDAVPVLDLFALALLFGLLFTRFVMVPGVQVDLPEAELQMQPSTLPVAVLTIGNRGMLLFNGRVFEQNNLEAGFREHIEARPEREVVLLVKTQGSFDMQRFLDLCRMARDAGFVEVQISGQHPDEPPPLGLEGERSGDFGGGGFGPIVP